MKNVKVSICIPAYNGEKYICQAIDSILNQTFKDIEIIVVDDCSKDMTTKIVEKYMENNSYIKLYRNEKNLGLVGNWNKAVTYATGEYVKVMCQDDILDVRCIEKQVKALDENKSVTLVTADSNIINDSGKIVLRRRRKIKQGVSSGKDIIKYSLKKGINIFGEPSIIMYRRDIISKIGIYNEKYGYVPDWDYSIRMLMEGDIFFIKEELFSFRISKNSETGRLFRKKIWKIIKEETEFFDYYRKSKELSLGYCDKINHNINIIFRIIMKYFFIKFYI